MHAVVARSTIQDFDQARKFLREEGIPRLSQMPGFVSGHWVRLGESSGASMIVFDSEESAQKAAELFRTNPPPSVTRAASRSVKSKSTLDIKGQAARARSRDRRIDSSSWSRRQSA